MRTTLTLEYWNDDKWFVGRLKEVPGVFSQGATLAELEANIQEAYGLLMSDENSPLPHETKTKQVEVEV